MSFLQFLCRTLEIGTCLLDAVLELLVIAVQLLVEVNLMSLNLVVLLPGVRLWPLHTDLESVILVLIIRDI